MNGAIAKRTTTQVSNVSQIPGSLETLAIDEYDAVSDLDVFVRKPHDPFDHIHRDFFRDATLFPAKRNHIPTIRRRE